ncbi:FkbM family methyltransferase [Sphingobium sp. BYY-5]|uniref:FkbM family methyltransferase n=1 Tax=Sphingobium sp. BYY-5 TaxID=2926400 RepID=UPI001FA7E05E|nr:FkbM family methyltransferase [Sphingobium sp. BYY-5]MCI4591435.1 FkbM family methyltransferase [Sphingobium sp. BYY-5]
MLIDETFSQFNEDLVIASVLGTTTARYSPYFVDVGANDGRSWSNSWFFGRGDWDLLLIEPIPRLADYCRSLYADKPSVIVEQKAISLEVGIADFFVTDELDRDLLQMGSSLSAEGVPFNLRSTTISVETCPLRSLLEHHNVPNDYAVLSVDAEGHDLAVLETADLTTWKPIVICVEMIYGDPVYAPIDQFLLEHNYRYAASTPANGIYIRNA